MLNVLNQIQKFKIYEKSNQIYTNIDIFLYNNPLKNENILNLIKSIKFLHTYGFFKIDSFYIIMHTYIQYIL